MVLYDALPNKTASSSQKLFLIDFHLHSLPFDDPMLIDHFLHKLFPIHHDSLILPTSLIPFAILLLRLRTGNISRAHLWKTVILHENRSYLIIIYEKVILDSADNARSKNREENMRLR